jgi:hypothetical protein
MRLFFLISFFLVIISCKQSNSKTTDNDKNLDKPIVRFDEEINVPADSFYYFYENCKLGANFSDRRKPGDKIVFHYFRNSTDYAKASDEEYWEEIHFEITPKENQKVYSTSNPKDFKTIFDWGCYCDSPDSAQSRQNSGNIELTKLDNDTWQVKLKLKSDSIGKEINIQQKFTLYKPEFTISRGDTLNRYDNLRRKQGHWITQDYFTIKNGKYLNDRFTGSEYSFMYYKDNKTLNAVYIYQDDDWVETIKFDEFGQKKKE